MSNSSRAFKGTSAARVRLLLGPRPGVLLGFAALVVASLVGFASVAFESQARASEAAATTRKGSEQRILARARVTADLTGSILATSAIGSADEAAKRFGGRTIDQGALSSFAKRSGRGYVLILDRKGRLLAASVGTPAGVRSRAQNSFGHIRQALEGRTFVSDVLSAVPGRGRVFEWAVPFESRFGRRVQVAAFDGQQLFEFVNSYLARGRVTQSSQGYVLDGQNRIVGRSRGAAEFGGRPEASGLFGALAAGRAGRYEDAGVERYFTSAPVDGSSWRVVLSEPTSLVYPATEGSRGLLFFAVLAAFALAGAGSLLFLRRALVSGARLAQTNRELTATNTTLEERVAERTAAAEDRARELARSNAELEQFASIASHDLQEPLRKIRMFGDRLRTKVGDRLPEDAAADLVRMQSAAERMQRLINDLLSFSRVTSTGGGFETVDLGRVAEGVLADLEARVLELDARVEVGDLPMIEADETQMRQLLQNLVSNALKFHRENEPPVVRIRGDVILGSPPRYSGEAIAGDRCVITVEDNGIGFDEKYADRVFTAFQRLHSRSAYDGTGIGLSIARKIVWRHGGDISVTSAPGQGSTFTVTLPSSHGNGHNGGDAR